MQVWCIENDKYAGRGTVYYKILAKPSNYQLDFLRIRAMMNPETSYWVTRLDETCSDAEVESMLQQEKFRKSPWFEKL